MADSLAALTEEELMQISLQNPELRFERKVDGTLVILPPTGGISGNREAKAVAYLLNWVESQDLGEVFGPSTGFKLENGAVRAPDAAFVAKGRLPEGWDEKEDEFLNLVPDFVIEIRSKSDSLETLKAKMEEYIAHGVRLGWLIDRKNRKVYIYRPNQEPEILDNPETVSGDPELPGFVLRMAKIW